MDRNADRAVSLRGTVWWLGAGPVTLGREAGRVVHSPMPRNGGSPFNPLRGYIGNAFEHSGTLLWALWPTLSVKLDEASTRAPMPRHNRFLPDRVTTR